MKFLFLCTGNSCRSILSEVLFNSRAPEGWKAYSAGSKPSGQVHPLTIETLENLGLSTDGLWSKTIDDCEQYQPTCDYCCDSALGSVSTLLGSDQGPLGLHLHI
ncbi:hypothetical protein MASRES_GEN12918_07225 [Acinetobacter baumannii]